MKLTLRIWRQKGPEDEGRMVEYQLDDVSPDMSFLEMLDVLNEKLILKGEDPIAVDHDCREGICGMCSLVIDGTPHGPEKVPFLRFRPVLANRALKQDFGFVPSRTSRDAFEEYLATHPGVARL